MKATMLKTENLYKYEYLDLQEAREYLGLSKLKLRTFIHEDLIPVFLMEAKHGYSKNNYKYYFKLEDLAEFKLILIMEGYYDKKKKVA